MKSNTIRLELEELYPTDYYNQLVECANDDFNMNLKKIIKVDYYCLQRIDGDYFDLNNDSEIKKIKEVFSDNILNKIHFKSYDLTYKGLLPFVIVEVNFLAGVTDNPANSAKLALKMVSIDCQVTSGKSYYFFGEAKREDIEKFSYQVLGNRLIESINIQLFPLYKNRDRFKNVTLPQVNLTTASKSDVEVISLEKDPQMLLDLSKDKMLALTLSEMECIRDYYRHHGTDDDRLKYNLPSSPTDVELEILAQTWSEHCKHKIFSAKIDYIEEIKGTEKKLGNMQIDGLFLQFIKKSTFEIKKKAKINWLISVFDDNAGIVRFDSNIDFAIKVETHNSPSALDPYGGALTGILGVNRDIFGAGMGASPIANTDVFCFAPQGKLSPQQNSLMPVDLKTPQRLLQGVHRGVMDGGNKSGIPTVNGSIFFDYDYGGKPLVFCGTIGVLPRKLKDGRDSFKKVINDGDLIFMVGGAIGADGIHGATFSSMQLDSSSPTSAVQIGDPLTQKRVWDFLMEARDAGLYNAITDNGAGGLSSSVGEMATLAGGATIDLSICPVKYPGLRPFELMISESQERMTIAVSANKREEFINLAKKRSVVAAEIGFFSSDGFLTIHYGKKVVARLDLEFLHTPPLMSLKAFWDGKRDRKNWMKTKQKESLKLENSSISKIVKNLLSSENIASKYNLVSQYDHEVKAATHIKPFMGDGPSDAGGIWLYPHGGEKDNVVLVANGIAPRVSLYDPYYMAQFAADEAIANVIAHGGELNHCCLLDNFCWPDPIYSEQNSDGDYKLGQLVRTCKGLYDLCNIYKTPLVSGKDSMKNDYNGYDKHGDKLSISILPTLLITSIARSRLGKTCTTGFKRSGDFIYLVGNIGSGLAASEYQNCFLVDKELDCLPEINLENNLKIYQFMNLVHAKGLLQSSHDISDGGLLICAIECMFTNHLGIWLDIQTERNFIDALFNEARGRFVVSISPVHQEEFEKRAKNIPYLFLGQVQEDKCILNINKKLAFSETESRLYQMWSGENK